MAMINTRLTAIVGFDGTINLMGKCDGEPKCVATIVNIDYFYIITGHRSIQEYNDAQAAQPVKFLVTKRRH